MPEVFKKHVLDEKKLDTMYFDLTEDAKLADCDELCKEFCWSYKLVCVNIQHFGIQKISEAVTGSKMKTQFLNNYKNLVVDYKKWKDFTVD